MDFVKVSWDKSGFKSLQFMNHNVVKTLTRRDVSIKSYRTLSKCWIKQTRINITNNHGLCSDHFIKQIILTGLRMYRSYNNKKRVQTMISGKRICYNFFS